MDVFPALLDGDVPFHSHEMAEDAYWNDIGSISEYLEGNADALDRRLRIEGHSRVAEGIYADEGSDLDGVKVRPPVLIGSGCEVHAGAELHGPVVIGDGCRIGEGAKVRDAVVLGGAELAPGADDGRGRLRPPAGPPTRLRRLTVLATLARGRSTAAIIPSCTGRGDACGRERGREHLGGSADRRSVCGGHGPARAVDDPAAAVGALYALPIAMVAVRWGSAGASSPRPRPTSGTCRATFALDQEISVTGDVVRAILFPAAALLVGGYANRARGGDRRAAERFHDVIETSHEAYVAMDRDGLITAWNREAERTFGLAAGEVLGRPVAEVIVPERFRDAHWEGLRRVQSGGETRVLGKRLELTAIRAGDEEFPIEITIAPVTDRDGETSYHAFMHDISDRIEAAAEADRLKSEFFALVSHELKTPLTAVMGFQELIEQSEGHKLSDRGRRYLELIGRSGEELNTRIGDLLLVAQVEAGTFDVDLRPRGSRRGRARTRWRPPGRTRRAWASAVPRPKADAERGDRGRPPAPRSGVRQPDLERAKVHAGRRRGPRHHGIKQRQVLDRGGRHRHRHRRGRGAAPVRPLLPHHPGARPADRGSGPRPLDRRGDRQRPQGRGQLESEPGRGSTFTVLLPRA